MMPMRVRVYGVLAEGLILGILLFALLSFGAVDAWARIIIHWATLALLGLTALKWLSHGEVHFPAGWLNLPIALLVLVALLSTAGSINRYGSMQEAMRIINYVLFFYLIFMNLTNRHAATRFLMTIVVAAALLPFAGAIQDWILAARNESVISLLPQSFRFATYPNENHFGAFLALVLPAGLGLAGYLFRRRRWDWFGLVVICLVLIAIALMETLTRATWVGVVVALLAMTAVFGMAKSIPQERRAWVVVGVVTALIMVLGLAPARAVENLKTVVSQGDTDRSMAFRYAVWKDSLQIIRDHPMLGTGLGTFGLIYTRYRSAVGNLPLVYVDVPHNDYLQYAVEMGVLAGVSLVAILLLLIYYLARHAFLHSTDPDLSLVLGVLGSVVAFLVVAFYSFEFYITANGLLFWAIAGVGVYLTSPSQEALQEGTVGFAQRGKNHF